MVNIQIQLPSREEIIHSLRLARDAPEELTDRELWILEEIGDSTEPPFDQDYWACEDGDF